MKSPAMTVALVAVLVACSGPAVDSTTSSTTPSTTTSSPATTTAPTTSTTSQPEEMPVLARYLATIEQGLEGTNLEGAAFEEPESLIRTGSLFCDLLDEGFGPVEVLRGWVAALSSDDRTLTDEDLLLGGVVLGSAVKFLCPEHLDALELARTEGAPTS